MSSIPKPMWNIVRETLIRPRGVLEFMASRSVTLLRYALSIVYIWFGALKLAGATPVAQLVAKTIPWVPPGWLVPLLGGWEIVIGLGLLRRESTRIALVLFFMQVSGTFLVLVELPEVAFQHGNPLLLTTMGEFVIKNVVLVTAGLVIFSNSRRAAGVESLPGSHSPASRPVGKASSLSFTPEPSASVSEYRMRLPRAPRKPATSLPKPLRPTSQSYKR